MRLRDEASAKAQLSEEAERRAAVDGLHKRLEALVAETTARLNGEVAEWKRGEATLRQELQLKEEVSAEARLTEEAARLRAVSGLQEQIRALTDLISATDRSMKTSSEAIRSELLKQAASQETEAGAIKEAHAEGLQKLNYELRSWIDEEISLNETNRAEDEGRVNAALETLRNEFASALETRHGELGERLEELRSQVEEAIVPLGEPGALTTLREALGRMDMLSEVVAQLCEHLAFYASSAEALRNPRRVTQALAVQALWAGLPTPTPRTWPRPRSPSSRSPPRARSPHGSPWTSFG